MAKKICHVALILVALFVSACHGMHTGDWTTDLQASINRMTQNINAEVQRSIQGLHAHIEDNVQRTVQSALKNADETIKNAEETIKNIPRDSTGRIITNGNTIIVNNGNGVSRSIVSGHTPDGEPFVRDVEERYDGNMIYHNETCYNPRTNTTEKIRWKLDLSTPGAKPEIITDN